MEDKIRAHFAMVLGESPDTISHDTRPPNLARWDSLQHLILVSSFEEEFGIDIDPEEVVVMYEDFGSFLQVVMQKVAKSK